MKLIHGIGIVLVLAGVIAVFYFLSHLPNADREKELQKTNDSLRTANARLLHQLDSTLSKIAIRDTAIANMRENIINLSQQHEENRVIIRKLPIDSLLRQQSKQLDDSI